MRSFHGFNQSGAPFYIPVNSVKVFQFLTTLLFCFLIIAFLMVWNDISLWFQVPFPIDYCCQVSFHIPVGHLYVFSGEMWENMQKNELNSYYATYTKINRTHIIDFDVKPKTIIFLEEIFEEKLFDIRCLYFWTM